MAPPPVGLVLLAQGMAAVSEVFGQRMSRRCHHRSILRAMVSMSVYCCAQAFATLSLAELVLPPAWTGGQGALSMWPAIAAHPWLLANAAINAVYWVALAFLLREPMGAVLVVVAFLAAAFFVDPLKAVCGLPVEGAGVSWGTAVAGFVGAVACSVDAPPALASAVTRWCGACAGTARVATVPAAVLAGGGVAASGGGDDEGDEGDAAHLVDASTTDRGAAAPPAADADAPTPALAVAFALAVLAMSTAAGVTFMSAAESAAGLNAVGYAALDQVLLPLTTLPLVAAMAASAAARRLVGEPPWSAAADGAPSFKALLARTWAEVNAAPPPLPPVQGGIGGGGARRRSYAVLPPPARVAAAGAGERGRDGSSGGAGRRASAAVVAVGTPGAADVSDGASAGAVAPHADGVAAGSPRAATGAACAAVAASTATFWWTLVPFHGLEFGRTFMLFYLVTAFDSGATYLTATLVRVGLVWVGALLANSALAGWVGVALSEARRALDPAALAVKVAGSACIVGAVLMMQAGG